MYDLIKEMNWANSKRNKEITYNFYTSKWRNLGNPKKKKKYKRRKIKIKIKSSIEIIHIRKRNKKLNKWPKIVLKRPKNQGMNKNEKNI